MRIAIYGVGGVGGYFGGRLAQAGYEVTFIARGEHLRAIQDNGLRIDSFKGDFHVKGAHATSDPHQVGTVDYVLVAVKAWQVPEAAKAMQPMVGEHTCVLPVQNGVDAPFELAQVLGTEKVLGGLCQISAYIAAPGHIYHVGIEPYIVFGELDNKQSKRTQQLLQAFEDAGVQAKIPDDIHVAMWNKFLFIAAVSGVGAVARAPVGVLRQTEGLRQMIEDAMQEIYTIARSRGVNLPEESVVRRLGFVDGLQPGVTASMQRDIMDGRPSELASQNGAVVRMGIELGIPTPINSFLYHSLLPQEMRARGQLNF